MKVWFVFGEQNETERVYGFYKCTRKVNTGERNGLFELRDKTAQ